MSEHLTRTLTCDVPGCPNRLLNVAADDQGQDAGWTHEVVRAAPAAPAYYRHHCLAHRADPFPAPAPRGPLLPAYCDRHAQALQAAAHLEE